ncbi:hypothetical protein CPC16_003984 [Podila verticillata]|nr:hypothetical protein CPC16_003984 [Podila verticillata]KFH67347.1 hypothetical protein MVEG_06081 [Podila verticillata NRRL 6337]
MTTLTLSEYQERTYIKQIGDFTLSCDQSQFSENESELSAAEESEALDLLERSGKRIHFVVTDEHRKNWVNIESERLDKE